MSDPKKQFVLTPDDKDSKLWRKLMAHWESKIEIFRTQNEGDRNETETAKLRGRIAELRANLNLDKDLPEMK